MDFKYMLCEDMDWIQLAQYRVQRRALVNMMMDFRVA
jgi:hypothetical protein